VRKKGIGHVPIVIDSHDKEISEILGEQFGKRYCTHGIIKEYHMDYNIQHVLQDVIQILIEKNKQDIFNYNKLSAYVQGKYCYENEFIGELYKKYRDIDDHILYIEIVKTIGAWETLAYCKDIILDKIRNISS
jgi:protein-disulfide isomerase-like protein with CxxC motif